MWPPGSPDLNPLVRVILSPYISSEIHEKHKHILIQDYFFWGFLLNRMGVDPHSSVEVMKQAVDKAWAELDDEYVKKACSSFP